MLISLESKSELTPQEEKINEKVFQIDSFDEDGSIAGCIMDATTFSGSSQAQVNPSITVVNVEPPSSNGDGGIERGGGGKTIIRTNSATQLNPPTTTTTDPKESSNSEQVTTPQPRLRREPSINYSVINPYTSRNGMRQDSIKTHPTRTGYQLQHQQSQQLQLPMKSNNEWQASFEMIPGKLKIS